MSSPRKTARLLAVAGLAASLVLAGCGGDDPPETSSEGDDETPLSPLTGLPLESVPKRPVMAVKIDNSSSSAPQVGLGSADMVVEELVEGGITRLAVFYYTDVPRTVGPVRSMRATDIGIVRPLEAVLVASGGAPQTRKRVKEAGIKTFTEGAKGYYRDTGRSAPYNLFMRLTELAGTLKEGSVPETYLPFGEGELPKGKPAKGMTVTFSPASSTSFQMRGDGYVNTNSFAKPGDEYRADTVLVLHVRVGDAGYRDPAGNPVPETKFTGKGTAMVFHDGRVVKGTWDKPGLDAPVRLSAKGGDLTLPPGNIWVELIPEKGGSVAID